METRIVSRGPKELDELSEAVLERAADLIFARGLRAVTTADVASAVGVSKKTLYRLFATKEDLMLAVVRREMAAVARKLDEVTCGDGGDFLAEMREFMAVLVRQVVRVSKVIASDVRRMPHLWTEIDRLRQEVIFSRLERLITRMIAEGIVRPDIDPRVIVSLHTVLVQNLVTPEQIYRLEISPIVMFETVIRIVYGGILTERGRRGMARELKTGKGKT
jgi:AcrR family transcriptional regulator